MRDWGAEARAHIKKEVKKELVEKALTVFLTSCTILIIFLLGFAAGRCSAEPPDQGARDGVTSDALPRI